MSNDLTYILKCLKEINPASLQYEEWLNVGLAIKNSGGQVSDWDNWSKADTRYREHDCEKKWNTFTRTGINVGTVVKLCRDNGGTPPEVATESKALDWNSTISFDGGESDLQIIRHEWLGEKDLPPEPKDWNGCDDFILYLETLFSPDEYVSVVASSWTTAPDKEGNTKEVPTKGAFHQTAGELIAATKKHKDLGYVIGDHKEEVGAWIRFNPLDGKGIHDVNVTAFRYALIESDDVSINKQYSIYKELELPIIALVTSGKKSLHAIVKVDAVDMTEYRNRVDYLYEVCEKNGLSLDTQNRNPSRLSRLPGVKRNGKPQRLIDVNIGQSSWNNWKDWVEEQDSSTSEFPPLANVTELLANPPALFPLLIAGLLRTGWKMQIAGSAGCGKSFLLLSLALSIAHGRDWLGFKCCKSKVLYLNTEIDEPSFIDRLKYVSKKMNIVVNGKNFNLWNLRGKTKNIDTLMARLMKYIKKNKYDLIIIDPIYKLIDGEESSSQVIKELISQLDDIAEDGPSVLICHHFSKGAQGQKSAMDRNSGSGVFSRDPDVMMTLTELENHKNAYRLEVAKARNFALPQPVAIRFEYPLHFIEPSLNKEALLGETRGRKSIQLPNAEKITGLLRRNPLNKTVLKHELNNSFKVPMGKCQGFIDKLIHEGVIKEWGKQGGMKIIGLPEEIETLKEKYRNPGLALN